MIKLTRTNSDNPDFQDLVKLLDATLRILDGDDHEFYAQYNKTANLNHTIVAYTDQKPVGSGALKAYQEDTMEVKRMYVLPEYRGRGIAASILKALEKWAAEMGFTKCVLETGQKQPEAISLYKKSGYSIIPNYGQYQHVENSVCFEKVLKLS